MSLEEQMGQMVAAQERTNALLENLLKGNTDKAPAKPKTTKPAPRKKAEPANDDGPTFDDLRAAFLAYRDVHGKETAITKVREIAGHVEKISGVPEDKYAAVIDALRVDDEKAAA